MNINFGMNVMGDLLSAGAEDTYFFTANAGDRITASLSDQDVVLRPEIEIYAPNNDLVASKWDFNNAFLDAVLLEKSGRYRIVVKDRSGENTGSYSLDLQRTNNPDDEIALQPGDNYEGTLNTSSDLDAFTFNAVSGDRFVFSLSDQSSVLNPEIRVYNPQGQFISSDWDFNNAFLETDQLSQTGQYTVLVNNSQSLNVGDYSFDLQRTNNPGAAIAAQPDRNYLGTLNPISDLDTFTFEAQAGNRVRLSLKERSSQLKPEIRVYQPDGRLINAVWDFNEAVLTVNNLPVGGKYTVIVQDRDGTASGSYTFRLSGDFGNLAPILNVDNNLSVPENKKIVVNVNTSDDQNTEGDGLTYTLTGGEDQSRFRINRTTGALRFIATPDFEQPIDANTNNVYKVAVTVTDAGGLSDVQPLTIRVVNVNENPPTGNLTLVGSNGRDTLTGMDGNDTLIGKGGRDQLTGNEGKDRFVFQSINDRIDRINDFEVGRDKVVLTDIFSGLRVSGYRQLVNQGYLEIVSFGQNNSRVRIDLDGTAGPFSDKTLVNVLGVNESELDKAKNFVF